MTHEQDERIGVLLREDAPPARDALFRIAVLERRERKRFRQRNMVLLATSAAMALILAAGSSLGADLAAAAFLSLVTLAFVAACLISIPGTRELVRRLQDRRTTTGKN